MTDTFIWKSDATLSGGGEFVTKKAQFGDGFSQEAPDGINNDVQLWSVIVNGYTHELAPVMEFIRAKAGGESFFWTPPLGVQGYYRCKKYSPVPQGSGLYTLTLEFQQVYTP